MCVRVRVRACVRLDFRNFRDDKIHVRRTGFARNATVGATHTGRDALTCSLARAHLRRDATAKRQCRRWARGEARAR